MKTKTPPTRTAPRGLSNKQKAMLHMAAADAGIPSKNKALYREVLHRATGLESAADSKFNRHRFQQAMAEFERIAESSHKRLRNGQAGYWQAQLASNTTHASQLFAIRQLASQIDMTADQLDAFVRRQTQNRFPSLGEMPGHFLNSIREGLQAIAHRKGEPDDQHATGERNESTPSSLQPPAFPDDIPF